MTNNVCRLLVFSFGFLSALLDFGYKHGYKHLHSLFDMTKLVFILLRGPCYHQTGSPMHVKQLPCQLGPSSVCFQNNRSMWHACHIHCPLLSLHKPFNIRTATSECCLLTSARQSIQSHPWSWLENFPLWALVPHIYSKRQHPLQPQSVHPAAIWQKIQKYPLMYHHTVEQRHSSDCETPQLVLQKWMWYLIPYHLHTTVVFLQICIFIAT